MSPSGTYPPDAMYTLQAGGNCVSEREQYTLFGYQMVPRINRPFLA